VRLRAADLGCRKSAALGQFDVGANLSSILISLFPLNLLVNTSNGGDAIFSQVNRVSISTLAVANFVAPWAFRFFAWPRLMLSVKGFIA
jgi:hypothetical protein